MRNDGLLITLEGGDAAGKSTQARRLLRKFRKLDLPALLVSEPGGVSLGLKIRRIVKFSQKPITPESELLLFLASRAQLVRESIHPALSRGSIVICDRFYDSTIVYQGYGRGLDIQTIRSLNSFATDGLQPNLTILLDVDPTLAKTRRQNETNDRFETLKQDQSQTNSFHQRVRLGYLELAAQEPIRWLVLDATLPVSHLTNAIWSRVSSLLATS